MVPQMNDVTFEVIVNTGSLIAIMFYYRQDIIRLIKSFSGILLNLKKEMSYYLILDFVCY